MQADSASVPSPKRERLMKADAEEATLLKKTYKMALTIAVGGFATLVSSVLLFLPSLPEDPQTCLAQGGYLTMFCTVCSTPHEVSPLVHTIQSGVVGAFIASICIQNARIYLTPIGLSKMSDNIESFYVTMAVNLIAGCGETITLFLGRKGRVCSDILGVQIPLLVHIEWLCTVPFLAYIALSLDVKRKFSTLDIVAVTGCFLMILTGWIAALVTDPVIYGVILAFSTCFLFCIFFSLTDAINDMNLIVVSTSIIDQNTGDYYFRRLLAQKKKSLMGMLSCLFPIFPIAYFMRAAGMITLETQEIIFILAGVTAKVGYANLCCDAYQEVGNPALAMLDAESNANNARRAFLRYIFHEVRVPLNSFTMGIELLANECQSTDIITMLRECCASMSETLNDILSLQKIEEGSMQLAYKPFSMMDLLNSVMLDVKDVAASNEVKIDLKVRTFVPARLYGDKFRLGHAVRSIVFNAIKYGKQGKVVKIYLDIDPYTAINKGRSEIIPSNRDKNFDAISSNGDSIMGQVRGEGIGLESAGGAGKKRENDLVVVAISVVDSGPGIPPNRISKIFVPFLHTRPEDSSNMGFVPRGAGLSLAICKEIVERHHGLISCTSKVGVGSVFKLHIPMSVVEWGEGKGLLSQAGITPTSSFSNGVHAPLLDRSIDESRLTSTKSSSSSSLPFLARSVAAGATAVAASSAQIAGSETLALPAQSVPTGNVDVATSIPSTPTTPTSNSGDTATCFREILSEYLDREEAQLVNGIRVEHLLSKASVTSPSERSPLSALVVDDVLTTRKMLSMMLKGHSIISTACCDGLECVNAVRSHEDLNYFDFIILDNTMPVMTGVEASVELRKIGYANFIVGVTGNSMEAELEEFSLAGADIVLSKPLTKSLISTLTFFFQTCGPKSIPGIRLCFDQQDKLVLKLRKK